ncbi:TraV family lipoprotein [Pseudoalteromonas sp. SR45-4]|uniref:TraV family lipoprotein n=1 Tax=Pseudoalteromonas sp. SR45-4 TaxID=2760929 RepID=UPI0015F96070|nr:TraV family lipoprotein [Pseudoalteromonas sp. SR45-4]MBB1371375.1 TraV family lipoprotein [Pseudoalteromonas sp. SR45-4]
MLKKLNKLSKSALLTGTVIIVSGCSSLLEVGEPPTECPTAANGGVTCTSARDVWKMTNNKDEITSHDIEDKSHPHYHEHNESKTKSAPMPYPGGTPAERKAIYTDYSNNRDKLAAPEPIAVRQDPKILRVLVNSWEDKSGRLHMPGYTYVEIEKRKWVVGRGATLNPSRITPLSIRKQSLSEERQHNPTEDNGMGIIKRNTTQ